MRFLCWWARRRLDAFSDGELPLESRDRLARHLAGCSACSSELAAIQDLRAAFGSAMLGSAREPSAPVWEAFWPQVRARLAMPPAAEATRRWGGSGLPRPRYVVGPAMAAAALAVLAVVAPWQEPGPVSRPVSDSLPLAPIALPDLALGSPGEVVIHSIETADPESPIMVYSTPESDMTVVWVFGLERTGI